MAQGFPDLGAVKPQWPVEIDWSHPMAEGLAFYVLCDEAAGAIELCTGAVGTPHGAPIARHSADGPGWQLASASSDYYDFGNDDRFNILGDISLAWRGILDTNTGAQAFVSKCLSGGGSNNPFDFRTATEGTSGNIGLIRAGPGGVGYWTSNGAAGVAPTATLITASVSQIGALGTAPHFYLNGIDTGTPNDFISGGTSGADTTTKPLQVGRRDDGVIQMNGQVSVVAGWSRILSPSEHASFHAEPYALLRSTAPIFIDELVGASFLAAWARGANVMLSGGYAA